MKKGKLITVYWLDHSSNNSWSSLEDIKKWVAETKKHPCVTTGYVAYQDKAVLVLADGNDGGESFGNQTLIFKRLIVKK